MDITIVSGIIENTLVPSFLALFIYFVICHIDDITTEPESDTDNEVED